MKHLIVGGVAGGATVAARLRRLKEEDTIILFERGQYVSYANCGLPYYIGDTIKERNKLFVQTVKGFTDRFQIDIRVEQEVVAIDREKKEVTVRNLATGESYTESYDKLVLSPGAEPVRPPIEGINQPSILTLRNVPDTDAIKNFINHQKPKHAVVVGGGFIGLEMVENLHALGIQVELVEMSDQVMAPLDFSMAQIVHHHLTDKGVILHLKDGVSRFEDHYGKTAVCLKSGAIIETDLVILSIGVRPETKLAKDAGLTIGNSGGIAVNAFMQTSDPDIYALGDATEVINKITGKPALIPLAGPANKQGRIVADNIATGNRRTYEGSIGTAIAKIFDLTVATAGANAKVLQKENISYISSYSHAASHAGYYPNAVPLSFKILFAPDNGRLLGAQVVGFDGVDKRIEMLEQVIQHNGTIYDLMTLEQAYAPPYSSAKDPVNMTGFIADNVLNGLLKTIHWREIDQLSEDTTCIDVRTPDEFKLGSIPRFINIPLDSLRQHLSEIDKEKPIVVTCAVGLRGYLAYRILIQHGFKNVRNLSGGYKTWHAAITPVKNPTTKNNDTKPNEEPSVEAAAKVVTIDACGLMCPGPVMQLKQHYDTIKTGEVLTIKATDQGFAKDVESWCKLTGAQLLNLDKKNGIVSATIRKEPKQESTSCGIKADHKTLIVFSDDLDKALASFVIANGAASTGKKVTMFFTFWGLNVIKKHSKPSVKKDMTGRMFGWMLPAHSEKLKLSKMNMGGMGSKMMRTIMKQKQIDSLEQLIRQAINNGVEMIACTMSMDVMGVHQEELLDHVTLGGVATYLERAEESNLNLFV